MHGRWWRDRCCALRSWAAEARRTATRPGRIRTWAAPVARGSVHRAGGLPREPARLPAELQPRVNGVRLRHARVRALLVHEPVWGGLVGVRTRRCRVPLRPAYPRVIVHRRHRLLLRHGKLAGLPLHLHQRQVELRDDWRVGLRRYAYPQLKSGWQVCPVGQSSVVSHDTNPGISTAST